ncbi:hypothetical protein BGZ81_009808 [Podila clonocystis]|nr:hypothetical protein BGZ81_009808 [Podila clonocystis]
MVHHGTEDKSAELLSASEHGLERITVQCRADPRKIRGYIRHAPDGPHLDRALCGDAHFIDALVPWPTLAQRCCQLTELQANVLAPEFNTRKQGLTSPWPGDELGRVWLEDDDLSGLETMQWGSLKTEEMDPPDIRPCLYG